MNTKITSLVAVLLAASATCLPAQSSREREREAERRAERLARNIEKTIEASIDGAMRSVENALEHGYTRQGDSRQSTTRIDTTFAFSSDGTVDLTSFNGDIIVTGWNRKEARVKASADRGSLRYRFSSSRLSVETDVYRGRTGESTYEVTVPEGVRVVLRSMQGNLMVKGVKGSVDLHTNNGDVEVVDATGSVEMVSLSGDAIGTRIRGDVDATSLSSSVRLTDVQGSVVKAESTSGNIELINIVSPDVEASTVSGEVEFIGPLDPKGRYDFQAHSGGVTLTIPPTSSARFSVETFSGEVESDFPFTLQPNRERRQGQRLEFSVGAGEARVSAESFSGGIVIRRANAQRR